MPENNKGNKKNIILMFPGQGSQSAGMGLDFLEANNKYYNYLDTSSSIFGENLVDILKNQDEKGILIDRTQYSQILIYTVSAILNDYLFNDCKLKQNDVSEVLGHSLGDYSALYSCGAFDFKKGAELVSFRGKLMAGVSEKNKDSNQDSNLDDLQPSPKEMMMAAVLGSDIGTISEVLSNYSSSVFIANYNDYSQIVISGYANDVLKAGEELKTRGAKRVLPLKVNIASHCPLMREVSEELGVFIEKNNSKFDELKMNFFSSTEVSKISSDMIRDVLVRQLTNPVKWVDSIEKALSEGANTFIEVGPGKVLSGLVKRIAVRTEREDVQIYSMDSMEEISNLKKYLEEKS
jgi:[acyl-carrier-protein] S-malonyltransferase